MLNSFKDLPQTAENLLKRPWYKKWWGALVLIAIGLMLISVILFLILTFSFYRQIKSSQESAPLSLPGPVAQAPAQNTFELITETDPYLGSRDAQVKIVEFSDFECPYCRQSFMIMRELTAQYGSQILYIYRDFPASEIHPNAQKAAEAGGCANEQGKFWPLHDKIFLNQDKITISDLKKYALQGGLDQKQFNQCLDSGKYELEVKQDLADGITAGVRGTPTFFINGQKIAGVVPTKTFKEIIDQLLSL